MTVIHPPPQFVIQDKVGGIVMVYTFIFFHKNHYLIIFFLYTCIFTLEEKLFFFTKQPPFEMKTNHQAPYKYVH